ncbi:hormogonium polysaccharide biosynthesis protein HpsA [Synechococcus sp. RC10B2]|uniref:hormogonium polysaccharide biosynthesis protein HpsA n=1 Tax=Synechococcus sp. RC10B2 TaxID=2964530 RepID=UPI0039C6843E
MSAPSPLLLKLALRLLSSLKIPVDRRRIRERGFVLPVAILIVLVLSLVTVGLLTRSTQRNIQTQVERAGQTVSRQLNAAIDRARAKIDYLIRDPRLPASNPTDAQLVEALINDGAGELIPRDENDPYILPDETQFVITTNIEVEDPNNPGQTLPVPVRAPAWWFLVDTDNNGVNDSVTAYTILNTRRAGGRDFEDSRLTDTERARRLMIRSGPLQGSALAGCNDNPLQQTINPNVGDWFQVGSALYKPFQVFAVTLPIQGADSTTRAISALQFQQDRKRDLLNKWGAFSRGDLEFFFTPGYNWNGAIYAGGSLFFRYAPNNLFRAFLISSQESCFYMPADNSEITAFGELVAGAIGYAGQQVSDSLSFDAHPGVADVPPNEPPPKLNNLNFDSVQNGVEPESVALDPLELHLFGRIRPRGNYQQDAAGWAASPLNAKRRENPGRIKAGGFQSGSDQVCPPYVDDVYRADNRFGPKASYERPPVTPDPQNGCNVPTFAEEFNNARAGGQILDDARNELGESLTADDPPPGALSEVGLDGYWERRARVEGLRVIVGQRLELTRTDSLPLPLVPPGDPNDPTRLQAIFISNEARQRLTLRDNPAAVQATAVYHHSHRDGRFPIACLATVAHPGSPWSLQRASTFRNGPQSINFFTGEGTNVWEYDPTPMRGQLQPGTPLWTALTNLANFAGDPDGAYPPRQEEGRIHPDPFITAFGNFSELRRVIDTVNRGTRVDQLSLADQTTLQTAGCMLGMLADNILRIEAAANAGDRAAQILRDDIRASRRGDLNAPERNRFYLPLRYIFPTSDFNQADPIESARRGAYSWLPPATYRAVTDTDLERVALRPRPTIGDWRLPHAAATCPSSTLLGGRHPNSNQMELIQVGDQCHRVPFKDSVFYDGREAMAVRALNIDLALLTNNVNGQANGLINGDTWLPAGVQEGREGGIFYAFREDAVREDAIARPPLTNFGSYQTAWRDANARGTLPFIMNAGQPGRNQPVGDPPVSNEGLSPKPVDYYPDPDRRPYGFRLRNGAVLARGGFNLDEAVFGLSFVSDNPVYIQGNFNLHQTRGGGQLEEFTTRLRFGENGLYDNFYRRLRRDEDRGFARAAQDLWRPSEVIGDSVNILSADFCDGSIDDGFVQDGTLDGGGSNYTSGQDYAGGRASAPRRNDYYGCSGPNLGANTSFLNQALVIRGNNWPGNGGVLRFDNTNGAQNLGDNTNQPGWPDVFARDTLFARRNSTDPNSNEADRTVGLGVPEVRQLRAPDREYANFGVRISALGNPVLDTSRWVMVAPLGPCPNPGGAGLLAEYYNGWLSSPQNQYDRNTGFADPNNPLGPVGLLQTAQNRNLPYLRAVRWPDPVFPAQGVPDAIGQYNNGYTTNAPTCNPSGTNNQRWACVRNAIDNPTNLAPFARSGSGFPGWGGFQYFFGSSTSLNSNSPFKRRLYDNSRCDGSLADIRQPLCRLSAPAGTPDRRDRGDWFWMPSCGEPDGNNGFTNLLTDADDLNFPGHFNFLRSCWRRRSGGTNSGNNNGNDFFVVRWVGELYPRWPGLQSYRILNGDDGARLIIRRRDGSNATFVNHGTSLSLGPNAAGAEAWQDGGGNLVTLRLELECADPSQPSPYLVEIQTYENTGSASLRFATRDGSELEDYDLRYLKPLQGVNQPCQPDRNKPLLSNQKYCEAPLNCNPIWGDWTPACDPNICQQTTITQTRTATLPAGCPGSAPTQETRQITCQPQYNYGPWSDWTPQCTQQQQCSRATITQSRSRTVTPLCPSQSPFTETETRAFTCQPPGATCTYTDWTPQCTVANGGLQVTQTRTKTCTSSCGTTTTIETQTVTCPKICNYDWGPWSPASCDEVIDQIACGTTKTFTQTRTGTLIASTSSPTCSPTTTQTQSLTCQGRPCGPGTFAPEAPGKSPFGEWMAAKPNTVELRPVHEIQADPEPETIGVNTVAKASTEGVTIALEPQLSPVLEVKAGVPKPPKWPSPAEALQAAFNWIFGEPAYAARNGLRSNVLLSEIANPSKEPGIRPAESVAQPIAGNLAPGTDDWARLLRRRLLKEDQSVRCDSEEKVGPDGGFWVPGVFRPNFNDRFKYTAYTGASRPSTLRTIGGADPTFEDLNGNGAWDPGEPTNVLDRDPLFGFDLDPNKPGLEIQPQMALNPYARVNKNAAAQGYTPASKYADGYYIDHRGSENIRNGLCFYVKPNGNTIQVQIDRDGGGGNNPEWVDVEPFTLDLNSPTTGFAGNNPVLGVILDEVTRRPIPIPRFQELASTDVNQRRRNDNGSQNWQLQPARETRVNAVAVSGVLPSRLDQTAGGMHNFLRLNELWRNTDLFFSGSMIQLNYSTYATGPFLQHSFEPPNLVPDPTFVRGFDYYFPPNRRFGYDVGLQIARRPGPVSARFQFPSNARTEFLRELDPQDPYVRRLRCELQNQPDVPLDPSAQIGGCNEFN